MNGSLHAFFCHYWQMQLRSTDPNVLKQFYQISIFIASEQAKMLQNEALTKMSP